MGFELKESVECLHNCSASFVEDVAVVEKFNGEIVWNGVVSVFIIKNHPKATKAFAWISPIKEDKKNRFYAVLNIPPIDTPEKAVRASIVQDYKTGNIK